MTLAQSKLSQDLAQQETYQALLRSLRRRKGFGIAFVQCSPALTNDLVPQLKDDLPAKTIGLLELTEPIEDLYELVIARSDKESIDILMIQGLEKSLKSDIQQGYGGDGDYYNLNTVPRVLSHLNQQRERFRDDFNNTCFVFILPNFAIKYFVRRAPDFYDWSAGVFSFSDLEDIPSKIFTSSKEPSPSFGKRWSSLNWQTLREAFLVFEKSLLHSPIETVTSFGWGSWAGILQGLELYENAVTSYDKALKIKPDYYRAWYGRGWTFYQLGRYEEAIENFDKALKFQANISYIWFFRGLAMGNLGRYEEAISSYDKALQLKPDDDSTWYNRGLALDELGRYEEAISSYDKALQLKPDDDSAWYKRGLAMGNLGRYEEAISSYDKALQLKPDDDSAWYKRGFALDELGCYEEAIKSYDKAIEFKSDYHQYWFNRGIALRKSSLYEEAIKSYDKAIEFKPDYHQSWYNRGNALFHLGHYEGAIVSYDRSLEFKPDYPEGWTCRGNAFVRLGQILAAISSYEKALEFKPDYPYAFYNKACCYAIQNKLENAIANLSRAIALSPDKYREMAKTDSDFDSIRDNEQFQALISG
jgi:tetratricopeptide (TPR) repeat protein